MAKAPPPEFMAAARTNVRAAPSMTPDLIRRHVATEATLRRYRRRDFDWKTMTTCIGMAWWHLRKIGRKPPKIPQYRSPLGALRVLKQLGCADCGELVGRVPGLERIAPAQMMMGDLCLVTSSPAVGEEGLPGAEALAAIGTVAICAGPQKIFGWRADQGSRLVVLDVAFVDIKQAWRV